MRYTVPSGGGSESRAIVRRRIVDHAGKVEKKRRRTRKWRKGRSPESKSVGESSHCNTNCDESGVDNTKQRANKQVVALDCEMVAVGKKSVLAKCSIIGYNGEVLFDEYVRPEAQITDYRTRWSGIRPHHMRTAMPHQIATRKIKEILDGSIVVGHDLINDFRAIGLEHPNHRTRDTAKFTPLREVAGLRTKNRPSLKNLAAALLNRTIQVGSHCSVEDARAALDIYCKFEWPWEQHVMDKSHWFQDQFWSSIQQHE